MTRPIMAYAALAGLGTGLIAPANAQTLNSLSNGDKIKLTLCTHEVAKMLKTTIDVVGRDGKLIFLTPALPPNEKKYDACVINADGSMTDIKGNAPVPGRPACPATELIKSCFNFTEPKAGS